ncbi:MAG: hypothetical protein RL090_32 [Bacteroidota bacterium]|jgi:5-methylcytosine-specific restriction endonuclease McrA
MLSLLHHVEQGKSLVSKREMFATMVAHAWYTVNYFHLSFGKFDRLHSAIKRIQELERLTMDMSPEQIVECLCASHNPETIQLLKHFNTNVPHWFLSPWFPSSTTKEIYDGSNVMRNLAPYALSSDFISLQPLWQNYFQRHLRLLRDFCFWNLTLFLQQRNPNVPDIPNKLLRPEVRQPLTAQRRYWKKVFEEEGTLKCIYSNKELTLEAYDVEHFVPYGFVAHHQLWNLIPADPSVNSSKGDRLPQLETYFNRFYQMQTTALDVMCRLDPENKLLEDYVNVFPGFSLNNRIKRQQFLAVIQPLITIASNNGFEFMHKSYSKTKK